jgi:hypothetical protein
MKAFPRRSAVRVVVTVLVSTVLAISAVPGAATGDEAQLKKPSKLAHSVQRLLEVMAAQPTLREAPGGVSGLSTRLLHVSPSGKIELVFHAAAGIGQAEVKDLEALGADIVATLAFPTGMIQAWVPHDQVETAANLPWVVVVTPPEYGEVDPHPNNPIDSEGVPLHNADVAHTHGITGAGVAVGVVSDGVTNLAAAQARNELPAVTVLAAGAGDEGTAMLEIVHDMAPGATLFFHATGPSAVTHVTAVQNLVAAGVNVIAEDIAFDAQPAFQQGVVANSLEAAAAGGVSVHSSSGNRGENHAARVLAVGTGSGPDGQMGPFTGCPYDPLNVVAIAPGGDTTFDVVLGTSTTITLQWSEPRAIFPTLGAGGFTDLDLFIMDAAGTTCLATATGAQGFGSGDTIEQIAPPAALAGTPVKIVVNVRGSFGAVAPPIIDLRWRNTQSETDTPTRAGSNNPDTNYTGLAFSIGAVNAGSGNLEDFSSAGPVDLVLTTVCPGGVYPCPGGGVAGPPAQQFQGLDFLGADGVSVSGVGGFGAGTCPAVGQGDCRFFGTSAAVPHTAGCDALVRQLIGAAAVPAAVRARLASTAVDFPPPGEDPTTGAGQVDCLAALMETPLTSVSTAQVTLRQKRPLVPDDQFVEVATFTLPAGHDIDPVTEAVTISLSEPGCGGAFSRLVLPAGSFELRGTLGLVAYFKGVVVDAVTGAPVTVSVRITRLGGQQFRVALETKDADYTCLEGTDHRRLTTALLIGDDAMAGAQCFRRVRDGDLYFPPGQAVCP